jgi:rSAM/selenodomain-associated transferase 2
MRGSSPPTLSVIIPTLDEEACIARAVRSVRDAAEVIVVDGGSHDGTRRVAESEGAVVLTVAPGRGGQLHAGARRAHGDWLVFLHADTWLEPGWAEALRHLEPALVGGAFRFAIDSARLGYRVVEASVILRCRVFRLPYGDQGLFVRRVVYEGIGGFPPIPLMEDVAFVRRLSRAGRLAFPAVRAFTSPRRWEQRGILSATVRNWWLLGQYAAGRPPEELARSYDRSWR